MKARVSDEKSSTVTKDDHKKAHKSDQNDDKQSDEDGDGETARF
jgi:hypothetical protein